MVKMGNIGENSPKCGKIQQKWGQIGLKIVANWDNIKV